MSYLLAVLATLAAIAVVVVLLAGLTTMVRPGMVKPETKTKIMQWRVYLQGLAVLFLVIAVMLASR